MPGAVSPRATNVSSLHLAGVCFSLSLSLGACGSVYNSGWLILVDVGWLILVGGDRFVTMVGYGGRFVSAVGYGGGGSELVGVAVGINLYGWFF